MPAVCATFVSVCRCECMHVLDVHVCAQCCARTYVFAGVSVCICVSVSVFRGCVCAHTVCVQVCVHMCCGFAGVSVRVCCSCMEMSAYVL